MIKVQNLSFSYSTKPILKNLSFRLEPGRFYGIIGPNGSGKTTLIRLLTRLEQAPPGALFLNDAPYETFKPKELARQLALLPQSRALPEMTVEQLVSYGRYPYLGFSGHLNETDQKIIRQALKDTNTLPFKNRPLKSLSGGERQRVYLAMLLAQDTPYLFLDEPTAYLDIAAQYQTLAQLRSLQNKCVVAVLHDLPLALTYCDELLVLKEGILQGCGAPEALVTSRLIDQVFGVQCCSLPDGNYYIKPKNT